MQIPCVGFGTYLTPDGETVSSVIEAVSMRVTGISTAAVYGNEKERRQSHPQVAPTAKSCS